ncbi:MAG TPA: acylphosphatase [Candidatus Acidoferrales bacterium]|nr:acylphosphatase [Candidatus Acidoferrales bacterium]
MKQKITDKIARSPAAGGVTVRDEPKARRYYISGIVQGVGFRYFAQRMATRLGISGYTKNLNDDRVEVYAIGPAESLAALRAALERGPQSASVSRVIEEEAQVDPRFAEGFTIEYDA